MRMYPPTQQSVQKLSDHRLPGSFHSPGSSNPTIGARWTSSGARTRTSLYIVQARPVTTIPTSTAPGADTPVEPQRRGFLGASPPPARLRSQPGDRGRHRPHPPRGRGDGQASRPGEVLVTTMTTPDMVPAMSRASAIVTDEGGMTCHAAIVSRELGVPVRGRDPRRDEEGRRGLGGHGRREDRVRLRGSACSQGRDRRARGVEPRWSRWRRCAYHGHQDLRERRGSGESRGIFALAGLRGRPPTDRVHLHRAHSGAPALAHQEREAGGARSTARGRGRQGLPAPSTPAP